MKMELLMSWAWCNMIDSFDLKAEEKYQSRTEFTTEAEMATLVSSWRVMFYALLVLQFAIDVTTARKITQRVLKEVDDDKYDTRHGPKKMHGFKHHLLINHRNDVHQNHMDHMDFSLTIFFTIDKLKHGETLPLYFSRKEHSTSPRLLSREEANSIPFSLKELPYLLQLFSLSEDSSQAKAVEYTLAQCELEPIEGEAKFCVTSLESMLDFARESFGLDTRLKVLTTNYYHHVESTAATFQNYTIVEEPKEILTQKMIGCHKMPYPYVVYYCHAQEGNRPFEVELGGENGEKVQAVVVCHMDTSRWDSDNPSFRVLNIEPGTSPVCHFFPPDDLLWVPLPA